MYEIEGKGWLVKYNPNLDNPDDSRESVFGINMIGFQGLINSGASFWAWWTFIKGASFANGNNFLWTWFGTVVFHSTLWIPLTLVWPASYFGGTGIVGTMLTLSQLTLLGPFLGYWLTMGAMYYTFIMEPTQSGSTFTD